MRLNAKKVPLNRIQHRMTFAEVAVRVFVGGVCVAGIGFVISNVYDAVCLRMKQRALLASMKTGELQVTDSQTLHEGASGPPATRQSVSEGEGSLPGDSGGFENPGSVSVIPEVGAVPNESEVSQVHSGNTVAVTEAYEKGGRASVAANRTHFSNPFDLKTIWKDSPAGSEDSSRMETGPLQGSPATSDSVTAEHAFLLPAFEVTDLISGRSYDPLVRYKGKVIVLDFWASWCAPCLEQMQILQQSVGEYDASQFQLIAVNTEESKRVVEGVLQTHGITGCVALDLEGAAASVFGVEALPTLVLMDQAGTVRRIHVGLEDGLATRLKGEIDQLLSGETLAIEDEVASQLALANTKITEGSTVVMQMDAGSLPSHDTISDVFLANGRAYSVGAHLADAERRFDRFLSRSTDERYSRQTSLTYPGTGQTSLLFSQRGEKLHGPLMSFHENGKRQTFIQYSFGKRIATLVMWDSAGRPVVMEEYRNGRKDGVRALFKSCGGECTTAHLWVAEEWRGGKLLATHVAVGGQRSVPNGFASSVKSVMTPAMEEEYRLANQDFSGYEERLSLDEEKLKTIVSEHYKQLKRQFHAQANARLIASGARTHSFASMLSHGSSRIASQRSMFSGPSMRTRNCGSS